MIYVIGGDDGTSNLSSVEMYNPKVEKENMQAILQLFHVSDRHLECLGGKHDHRKELHWSGSDRQA